MRILAVPVVAVFLAAWATAAPQTQDKAEVALKGAMDKEILDGNLKVAIEQYRKITMTYRGNRSVVARALVHMGQCYEKLGDAEARKAYERVVREFGDQKEAVAEARKHLDSRSSPAEGGVVVRQASGMQNNRWFGRAISRDGKYIAFVDNGIGLGVYEFATGQARDLPSQTIPGERVANALVSPDGGYIAYQKYGLRESQGFYIIGTDGSNSRRLVGDKDVSAWPWGWSPDGKHVLAGYDKNKESHVALVSVDNGSAVIVASRALDGKISPDGRYIALVKSSDEKEWEYGEIVVVGIDGGRTATVVSGRNKMPLWSPDGKRLLLVSDRNGKPDLWSIQVENGTAVGPLEFVQNNVDLLLGATPAGEYYYNVRTDIMDLYVADLDPETGTLRSRPKQITTRDHNSGATWSPDGEMLAYYAWRRSGVGSGKYVVVIRTNKSGEERELQTKEPLNTAARIPQWFPDSRTLLVHSYDGTLRRLDVYTGAFSPVAVTIPPFRDATNSTGRGYTVLLAPDGRSVYYLGRDGDGGEIQFLRRPLDGGPEKEVCRIRTTGILGFSISPDGSRLVFVTAGPKTASIIWTAPTSGGTPQEFYRAPIWPQPTAWPHHPMWSKDGRWLYVVFGWRAGDVYRFPAEGGEPKALGFGLHEKSCIAMSPDGRHMAFANEQFSNNLWVLKNLFPGARQSR